jgi:endonuclease III
MGAQPWWKDLAEKLASLGMQKKSASNILYAAKFMIGLSHKPHNYWELLALDGVGAKIALVTLQEAHGKAQGVPCDIHWCWIKKVLNWVPSFVEKEFAACLDMLENSKGGRDKYDYELAGAAIDGWFPPSYRI